MPGTPTTTPLELDRRSLLAAGAAGTGAIALGLTSAEPAHATANPFFRHGVASGDPHPDSVVLWTRVTPTDVATPGSGLGSSAEVRWEVARDTGFRNVVSRGRVVTGPRRDHTVKVEADGLRPSTSYYYRFVHRGVTSRTGRTKTAPGPHDCPRGLRFGVVSCSNLQAGWFSPYRHLAKRSDLDAVLHLGDYLYEYEPGHYGYGSDNEDIRSHVPAKEMVALADYRQRHAQYKQDRDLQDLHAKVPFIVTWDDHENTNDAWRDGAENHQPDEGDYQARRASAYRAYDEWMPVRMGGSADLDDRTLYRSLKFGSLAEILMLDLRTYRSEQVSQPAPPAPPPDEEISDPSRTITGNGQMRWLKGSLRADRTQWKLVGNPVMVAPVVFPPFPNDVTSAVNDVTGLLPDDGLPYNVDQWDGYTADRRELLDHLADYGIRDTVFLTGDIHSAWACDLPLDAGTYPAEIGRAVATELVCTSVTSNNLDDLTNSPPRTSSLAVEAAIQANNRHVKYLNFDDHGYSVLDVTSKRTQMDYYVISDRRARNASSEWTASWATEANSQAIHPVDRPVDR